MDRTFVLKGPPSTTLHTGEEGNHDYPLALTVQKPNHIPRPMPVNTKYRPAKQVDQIKSTSSTTAAGEEGTPMWPVMDGKKRVQEVEVWGCQDDGGIGSFSRKATPDDVRRFMNYRRKPTF